jgi:hypothetical protein
MKRSSVIIATLIVIGLIVSAVLFNNKKTPAIITPAQDHEGAISFFQDTITKLVQTTVADYNTLGLGGGVDGFVLMKSFPKLVPSDFVNVVAIGGEYSVEKENLLFTGNAASNSAVLKREGIKTLLQNCSKRLKVSPDTKEGINKIVELLL